MTTQKKFEKEMARVAEMFGVDVIIDHSYANTGVFRFQPRMSFDSILEFPFDFQTGYASFGTDPDGPLGTHPEKKGPFCHVESDGLDLVVDRVIEALERRIGPPQEQRYEA